MDRERRRLLLGVTGALTLTPLSALGRLLATPEQSRGPFYPTEPPLDRDNDLVRVDGRADAADGVHTHLVGRVVEPTGAPIDDARVEIWQCDARGHYHHTRAPAGERDPNFQGFGVTRTDAHGRYRFRAIRPVPYPGRAPHIHFRVVSESLGELVTQMYVAGHPMNADDAIFRSAGPRRRRLAVAFEPADGGLADRRAQFDIVMPGDR